MSVNPSARRQRVAGLALLVALAPGGCTLQSRAPAVLLEVETAEGPVLAFVPARMTAPPNAGLTVTFRNRSDQPHNLTFGSPLSAGTRTIVGPGESDVIELAPSTPGDYRYVCTIHAGMEGVLRIE